MLRKPKEEVCPGNVYVYAPETVKLEAKAPEIVSVLAALFVTPVPPLAGDKAEPKVNEVNYEAASTTFVPLL